MSCKPQPRDPFTMLAEFIRRKSHPEDDSEATARAKNHFAEIDDVSLRNQSGQRFRHPISLVDVLRAAWDRFANLAQMILLVFLNLALLTLLFWRRGAALRESVLRGFAVWGTQILVVTEVLSVLHAITPLMLAVVWAAMSVVAAFVVSHEPKRTFTVGTVPLLALSLISGVLLLTAIISIFAPPNNWDSMTYHMARVANWRQHASVRGYPTHITRQISLNAWAEFAVLHFQVLSFGSDRWANLVQWLAGLGSAVAVSLILRQMKYRLEIQLLGALLVVTAPMLILQSTSTQNDLVCGLWVASCVFFLMQPVRNWFFAALCLALAISTKTTGLIFLLPFVLTAVVRDWRASGYRTAVRRTLIALLIVIGLNAPFYLRNRITFGHWTGDPAISGSVQMQVHDPIHILSNVVRNASLHWATPIGKVTWAIERAVVGAHEFFGVDASDPRSTWGTFHVQVFSNHEDIAGNFLLFWVSAGAFVAAFVRRKRSPALWLFAWQLGLSLLLFCTLLKWQPWHSRLHVPLFVLASVLAAAGIGQTFRSDRAIRTASLLFFIGGLPWLFLNRSRPLVTIAWTPPPLEQRIGTWRSVAADWISTTSVLTTPRQHQLFANVPEMEKPYHDGVTHALAGGCKRIGLVLAGDAWEYPVHVFAREISAEPVTIEHVFVKNATASLAVGHSEICSILVIQQPLGQPNNWTPLPATEHFTKTWESGVVSVYRKT